MLLKVSMKTKLTDNPLLSILDSNSDKFSQKVHKYSQQTQTAFSYFFYGGKQRTYLCNKRLIPSHTITKKTSEDRAGIEQIKSLGLLHQRHVCFCNPCAGTESHLQECAWKLCSATLKTHIQGPVTCYSNNFVFSEEVNIFTHGFISRMCLLNVYNQKS